MRRHITSRILLSFLLLWQLGAGVFVHAHGVAAMGTEHVPPANIDPAPALEEHCADHAAMMTSAPKQPSTENHAHMAMDEASGATQDDAHGNCCQSLLCNCPCMQALALSLTLPYVPTALPDAQTVQVVVTPFLNAGITGLFRPPI